MVDPRYQALLVLQQVLQQHRSLTEIYDQMVDMDDRDRALMRELAIGSIRWYSRLQAITNQLLTKPLSAKDYDLNLLIILGLYQLEYTRIPAHAAIHASVELCKKLKKIWAKGLLNACLRRYIREKDVLLKKLTPAEQHALPEWLYQHCQQMDLSNFNQPAQLTLRINRRKISRHDYQHLLSQQGINVTGCCQYSHDGLRLNYHQAVDLLPGYHDGLFSVQDEAAQLAAGLLTLTPGMHVLDACAAPGGKTSHIAESCDVSLIAIDNDSKRVSRIKDNLRRLQLKAEMDVANSQERDWWDGKLFDRILLDAPCSATGVIRRHPDIKWLRRESDIAALVETQKKLLENLWGLLKMGGRLVYATCSLLPQENELQIAHFLSQHYDAKELVIAADWGQIRIYGRQIVPGQDNMDGFYYAVLEKTA